jgi:hypothetical protein
MSANDVVDTGVPLPRMAEVRTAGPLTLMVTWAEGARAGRTDRVDLAPVIDTLKIFRPLRRNEALFATVRLGDQGDTVVWAGDNLEMHAETVELLAEQAMSPQDFIAFLKRNRLTQEAAAAILGYSRRQIGYFTTTGPIPRVVALACKGYEAEQLRTRTIDTLRA